MDHPKKEGKGVRGILKKSSVVEKDKHMNFT